MTIPADEHSWNRVDGVLHSDSGVRQLVENQQTLICPSCHNAVRAVPGELRCPTPRCENLEPLT